MSKITSFISAVNDTVRKDGIGKSVMAGKISSVVWSVVRALLLIGLAYIILYPILFSISVSIRSPDDMLDPTVVWLPKTFTLSNVKFVFEKTGFIPAYFRTLGMSLACSLLQMLSCAITGYGFARFKFKGRNILFLAALLTFIVPPQIISMPLYIQYSRVTMITSKFISGGIPMLNTPIPISLSALLAQGLKSGLFIYLFRQSYKSMPIELEDAAYLDGCGPVKAFTRIMFVNSAPILLVSFLLSFVWYWNDYINISLFYNKAKPLAVLLQSLSQVILTMRTPEGLAYGDIENNVYTTTFCLLFIITPIIVYAFLQKKFTESLISTSIVG